MRYYALWLALICIVFFILQQVVPGFTETLTMNSELAFSQPWRFVTSIFLHANLLHLVYNLFALLMFGLILEKFINKKFLLVFFLSGILANIIGVFFYAKSLGASGAVFGIIGCLVIIKPLMTVWAFSLPMPLFLAAALWLTGDLLGFTIGKDNVAHIAHITGLAVGLILGIILLILKKSLKTKHKAAYSYKIEIPEYKIKQWEDDWMC